MNLSYVMESDGKIGILSTTESLDGLKLLARYAPTDPEGVEFGDDVPEELEIEEPDELLGKEIFFKVEVNGAENLPASLCKNAFVTYAFKHDPTPYKTEDAVGKKTSPKWKYEKQHRVTVDQEVLEDLKEGHIVFKTWGQPDFGAVERNDEPEAPTLKAMKTFKE